MKKIAIHLIMLSISLGCYTNVLASAYMNECVITDINDTKYYIKGGPSDIYLEIIGSTPKKWLSVRAHNIKEASFTNQKNKKVHVSVLLKNGQFIEGERSYNTYKVRGENQLGAAFEIGSDKIKKIEYVKTQPEGKSGTALYYDWKVTDGKNIFTADLLLIKDSYLTNYKRVSYTEAKIYDKFIINDGQYYGEGVQKDLTSFPFLDGFSEIDIPIYKISSFEITGKTKKGKPEVIIKTIDGKTATVSMRMAITVDRANGYNATYGAFSKDDYYIMDTIDYGQTGISFLPLRRIFIERH